MGLCLSCLGINNEEEDLNERSSLLGSNNLFSDEDLQEGLLKQQQRQNELSVIVNDLTDNLIDVSTFLSTGSNENYNGKNTTSSTQSTSAFATANGIQGTGDGTGTSTSAVEDSEGDKSLPYIWPVDRKQQLMSEISASNSSFNIEKSHEPFYVVF